MYARGRPQRRQRLYFRTLNFGARFAFSISAFFAKEPFLLSKLRLVPAERKLETLEKLERFLDRSLKQAERIASLEAEAELTTAAEVTDQIQTIEERITASDDTLELERLIDQKAQLVTLLSDLDEKQATQFCVMGEYDRVHREVIQIGRPLAGYRIFGITLGHIDAGL